MGKVKSLALGLGLAFAAVVCALPVARAEEPRKPAVCFLSRHLPAHYGGTYLRQNLARLDGLGYRVAYYSFEDLDRLPAGTLSPFDVVVMLQWPQVDYTGTKEITAQTVARYAEMRSLLKTGGGLLLFLEPSEWAFRAAWPLVQGYGLSPAVGCFAEANPTLGIFDVVNFGYTTNVAPSPLTGGVKGVWYPVGGKTGTRFDFDTLRNANTTPFVVDRNWTTLLATGNGTEFATYEQTDSPFLLQPQFQQRPPTPAPLVAIREQVEGAGRLAVCGINSVYSNFIAGNTVYDGVCTGKGLEAKPSGLDTVLMNVLQWLAAPSQTAERETVPTSLRESFKLEPFQWAPPLKVAPGERSTGTNPDQFRGLVGARTTYSGGKSTVAEYARTARELGLDFVAFLEDFGTLNPDEFDSFKAECAAHSDDRLLLIPGIRVDNILGIHYFGFRVGLVLPQPSHLQPGTRLLTQQEAGQYQWSVKNGDRTGMATGNYRLDGKDPSGVPPSDYNVLNPFISLYTYQNGKLSDTLLDTYLKCAARTEWVSPIALHLVDSAEELRRAWTGDGFQTVWLRDPGQGLAGMTKDIGERYGFAPISYVTSGPKIEAWHSNGFDCAGEWFDWTRYRWFVRLAVSSEVGLKEVKVMNGPRLFRRFLPGGAQRFEQTLVLNHNDMHNLILIVTDNQGRQAISDEEWDKNQLLQLTWCADRNNQLSWAGLPDAKSVFGSAAGGYPTPVSQEKGGFRESLSVDLNTDRSYLPGFDGQPNYLARVSPAPSLTTGTESEGDQWIARDIGRDLCSPDVAIQTSSCRLKYPPSVTRPHPWTRGPLVPMELFNADLRYITFAHPDHLPVPVILEGRIKLLRDVTIAADVPRPLTVCTLNAWRQAGGYKAYAIQHSRTGNHAGLIYYEGGGPQYRGDLNRGAYLVFYPSAFGAVGLMALDDGLAYTYWNWHAQLGFPVAGQTLKAGTELTYRVLVVTGSFDDIAGTELMESIRSQLGLAEPGKVGYQVALEQGTVKDQRYVLTIDGQGKGFAGEITLPERFPVSLPVVVENLNDKWTSVLYERESKRLRPLGMFANAVYCHRAPEERKGKILIGHPFTLSSPDLSLSVVRTGEKELTLQIHNPTDREMEVTVSRNPIFDFVAAADFAVTIPAGQTIEKVLGG